MTGEPACPPPLIHYIRPTNINGLPVSPTREIEIFSIATVFSLDPTVMKATTLFYEKL
jgi:hypothetical protein